MTEAEFIDALRSLGIPGGVLGLIAAALYWRKQDPREDGFSMLTGKIDALTREMTDRLARLETEVKNLKGQ